VPVVPCNTMAVMTGPYC